MEVKAVNTRREFDCTKKDKIMFNGCCYQLVQRHRAKHLFPR